MSKSLRLLVVEDSEAGIAPLVRELRQRGYEPAAVHVANADAMRDALQRQAWDVVIADHGLSGFSSQEALRVLQERGLDLPFIIVSETTGEEAAVMAMKAGAHDYVTKEHLTRLGPAVERELQEASVRRQRKEAEHLLAAQQAVTRLLAEADTLGEAGGKILQAIAKDGEWEVGEIWTVDRSRDVLRCLEIWHAADKPLGEFETRTRAMTFPRGVGLPGRVWASRQPAWVADVTQDAHFPRAPLAAAAGLCGAIGFPIVVGHEVIGVLAFFRTSLGQPDEKLLAVLNAVASQTGQFLVRQRAEEELKRLSSAVQHTANCVLITDRHGVIEYVNPAFERTTGYAREEVIGKTPRLLKSGRHDQKYYETLWNTILAGQTIYAEFVNRKKSGELYRTEQTITPIRDTHEHITHFVSTGRDVTERARAADALRLFRALVDQSNDAIEVVDPETGRFLDINEKGCLDLGYSREEYLALSVSDLDPTVSQSEFPRIVEELRKSGVLMWEGIHRRKDGSTFPVEVSVKYVQLDRDYIVAVVRNATERQRAEAALRASEEIRRLVLDNVDEIIYMVELDGDNELSGQVRFVSSRVETILGYLPDEFIRDRELWFRLIHPDDAPGLAKSTQAIFASGRPGIREYRVRHKRTGNYHWMEDRVVPQRDTTGLVVGQFGTARDVTERKQLKAQLLRTQRLESIGRLAGGVAHDLNNALAPIMMATELLRLEFPDTAASYLDLIQAGARRGADMVKRLLTFAKGADGERLLVQPEHLLKEMQKLITSTFSKNIQLQTRFAKDLWTILGDATQLHQVLLNLCVNARDAMPEGGTLTLEAENKELDAASVSAYPEAKPGRYVAWRVTDTGTGIPPEILEHIFDPFFTTKGPDKGTGLGLSTVIGIVKGHGGFVRVYSTPAHGSTFAIYLPAYGSGAGDTSLLTLPETTFRGHGETILVVDDEVSLRNILRTVLTKLNFKVLTAADGTAALNQVAEYQTELRAVITDLHMPGMDGLAFVRILKGRLPEAGIIVVSGRLDEREADEFRTLGVNVALEKPFPQEKLLAALKTMFQK